MRELARRYGWRPSDVSDMTWPQIMMYLDTDNKPAAENGHKVIQFSGADAMSQYAVWRRANFGVA